LKKLVIFFLVENFFISEILDKIKIIFYIIQKYPNNFTKTYGDTAQMTCTFNDNCFKINFLIDLAYSFYLWFTLIYE
jgi:hypothetical protein